MFLLLNLLNFEIPHKTAHFSPFILNLSSLIGIYWIARKTTNEFAILTTANKKIQSLDEFVVGIRNQSKRFYTQTGWIQILELYLRTTTDQCYWTTNRLFCATKMACMRWFWLADKLLWWRIEQISIGWLKMGERKNIIGDIRTCEQKKMVSISRKIGSCYAFNSNCSCSEPPHGKTRWKTETTRKIGSHIQEMNLNHSSSDVNKIIFIWLCTFSFFSRISNIQSAISNCMRLKW